VDILDDMGVSKLSAKVFFFKVNYSFKRIVHPKNQIFIVHSFLLSFAEHKGIYFEDCE